MPNKKYIEIQGLSDTELAAEIKETQAQYHGLDSPKCFEDETGKHDWSSQL